MRRAQNFIAVGSVEISAGVKQPCEMRRQSQAGGCGNHSANSWNETAIRLSRVSELLRREQLNDSIRRELRERDREKESAAKHASAKKHASVLDLLVETYVCVTASVSILYRC